MDNQYKEVLSANTDNTKSELTEQIIFALSSAVEAKDCYTNGHSYRVAYYAQEIARRLGWDEEARRRVFYTGLLHDIGKLRVTDAIINKADILTENEYEEMKLHTLSGYYILKEISTVSDFAVGARWHHERYDGKGYPNGLSGKNIPLISRIVCVADAYDAMTSNRSYRNALSQKAVIKAFEEGLGTQFDPVIGKIMLQMISEDKEFSMHEPIDNKEYTILAVDDDSMVLRLLDFTLSKQPNYHLVAVSSGEQALKKLSELSVDLVLLDVEMPEMNGFEVLEKIRNKSQKLPVIFMTGEKEMSIIQKAESMGVSDYLTKPLVPHMLYESIRNVLNVTIRKSPI